MKRNILTWVMTVVLCSMFYSCDNDLPKADFSRYQVDGVSAVSGDESVTLSWTPQAGKPTPKEYLITWSSTSADATGGEMTLAPDVTSAQITGLINDCVYTFGVQARYPEGLAQMITAKCQPKSTRIPVSEFKAMAGDKRVYVAWVKPKTTLSYTYRLVVSANGAEIKTLTPESSACSYLVENLDNGTEYTFTITCVYSHGNSVSCEASATPGEISPMAVVPEQPRRYELAKLEYNPAYFVMGEIDKVEWKFEDGTSITEPSAVYFFPNAGDNSVTISVTYVSGVSESATMTVNVLPFAWDALDGTGYQKSSTLVFSPDGQQCYTISQNTKTVFGINAITGAILWQFGTDGACNGAGPAVAPNGSVIFGTEDGDGNLYALSPNGTVRWNVQLGNSVKASPAVTSDGIVYALCDGGKLTAIDVENGNVKWTATETGNAGAVAVDGDGTIFIGTSEGVWAYSSNGTRKWASDAAYAVSARGGHIAIGDDYIYVTLLSKAGVVAINKNTGAKAWQYKTAKGDCYHPVVDGEGTVYFCEKSGNLYAVKKDGTLKWATSGNVGYTQCGFALDNNGNAYISQYASPFNLLKFDAAGTETVLTTIGKQTMSPVTIGPDRRIYYGMNGSLGIFDAQVKLGETGWPCRGANAQGTNSLK